MIRFEQVSKRYPNGHMGLDNLSFHIKVGEMVFITGHSGAGKSTLLKLIMCMERPSSGQVHVGGQNLRELSGVALPLIINGTPPGEVGRRVRAALDKVGLLSKESLYPIALSGGEQQRVGVARAVVHKPALLLADEPTGNLDPSLSAEIMSLFEDFNRVGVTVIIASHDLPLIATLDHRMLTLDQGRLLRDGE